MSYVYKHTRIDNNQIFYIGIGANDNDSYKRAYSEHGRNKWWYKITNKTKYKVEILYSNLEWTEACEREKELIKVIGRRTLNEGTLVNITEGGEGINGLCHSEETKFLISEIAKNQWANCDIDYRLEINKKISIAKKGIPITYKDVICPHCKKKGKENVMYKWHFDNCKNINPDKFFIKINDENKKYLVDNNIKPSELCNFMKIVKQFVNSKLNISYIDIRKMNRDQLLKLYIENYGKNI